MLDSYEQNAAQEGISSKGSLQVSQVFKMMEIASYVTQRRYKCITSIMSVSATLQKREVHGSTVKGENVIYLFHGPLRL